MFDKGFRGYEFKVQSSKFKVQSSKFKGSKFKVQRFKPQTSNL
jgi:hypothetical protein